jgi:hypothetical protein
MDGSTIGRVKPVPPVQVHLKYPLQFPHHKKYPLKPEAQKGLLPIINNLKQQGFLVECSSPNNFPILAVQKGPNKWRLAQDLQLINEAVMPLYPVVPNPYTLLAQIPPGA